MLLFVCFLLHSRTHRSVTRAKGSSEFGGPQRRVTDSLLVLNAVMFAAQLLTKQGLTAWGAKVRVFHMNSTAIVHHNASTS